MALQDSEHAACHVLLLLLLMSALTVSPLLVRDSSCRLGKTISQEMLP
jgi:hypothetical protein